VARGFLCGALDTAKFDAKDIRRGMARFQGEAFAANLLLLKRFEAIAAELGCTAAQLAIAWLLHQAPHIIPIPGTTSAAHMQDNIAASQIVLSAQLLQKLDALVNAQTVVGARYDAQSQSEVDTESK
jgi:aryl-alcohol dehydrogenase-like predicted oxidoreductase